MAKEKGAGESAKTGNEDERTALQVAEQLLEDQGKRVEALDAELGAAKTRIVELEELVDAERRGGIKRLRDLEQDRSSLIRENGELRGALRKATKDQIPDLDGKACVLKESVTVITTTGARVGAQPNDICVAKPDEELNRLRREVGTTRKVLSVSEDNLTELVKRGLATPT